MPHGLRSGFKVTVCLIAGKDRYFALLGSGRAKRVEEIFKRLHSLYVAYGRPLRERKRFYPRDVAVHVRGHMINIRLNGLSFRSCLSVCGRRREQSIRFTIMVVRAVLGLLSLYYDNVAFLNALRRTYAICHGVGKRCFELMSIRDHIIVSKTVLLIFLVRSILIRLSNVEVRGGEGLVSVLKARPLI